MNELFEAKDLNLLSDDPFAFFCGGGGAEFLYVQILRLGILVHTGQLGF